MTEFSKIYMAISFPITMDFTEDGFYYFQTQARSWRFERIVHTRSIGLNMKHFNRMEKFNWQEKR
jgi:hypothetical protein